MQPTRIGRPVGLVLNLFGYRSAIIATSRVQNVGKICCFPARKKIEVVELVLACSQRKNKCSSLRSLAKIIANILNSAYETVNADVTEIHR